MVIKSKLNQLQKKSHHFQKKKHEVAFDLQSDKMNRKFSRKSDRLNNYKKKLTSTLQIKTKLILLL